LIRAAKWWHGYVGIHYLLILKVSAAGDDIKYCLYDVARNPMDADVLPAAIQEGHFQHDPNGAPEDIELDNHHILSIPADQAFPPGVNDLSVVNLRNIMDMAVRRIRRRR
jgi:hypothetical protein